MHYSLDGGRTWLGADEIRVSYDAHIVNKGDGELLITCTRESVTIDALLNGASVGATSLTTDEMAQDLARGQGDKKQDEKRTAAITLREFITDAICVFALKTNRPNHLRVLMVDRDREDPFELTRLIITALGSRTKKDYITMHGSNPVHDLRDKLEQITGLKIKLYDMR